MSRKPLAPPSTFDAVPPTKSSGKELAIKLHPTPQFSCKQSSFGEHLPSVPLRGCLLGPSGCGKTTLFVDLICRLYRGCFKRVYVFSPSVNLDSAWDPVKKYVHEDMGVDPQREQCFFDRWDPEVINGLFERQVALTQLSKKRELKTLYSVLFCIDDFADQPEVVHSSRGAASGGSLITTLFLKGRHAFCSVLLGSQKLKLLSSAIRVNTQFYCIWRLRSAVELASVIEELSALHDRDTLHQMYEFAVSHPWGFWFINMVAKNKESMFYVNFDKRLTVKDANCQPDQPDPRPSGPAVPPGDGRPTAPRVRKG